MSLRDKSRKQLERDEGRKKKIYRDSEGIETIGIGINLQIGLSDEEIDMLFNHRWGKIYDELLRKHPWAEDLDEARLGALMNMAFNLGIPRLSQFVNMLSALKEKRWADAKKHALDSKWAKQVKDRAPRIAKQIETGEWQ